MPELLEPSNLNSADPSIMRTYDELLERELRRALGGDKQGLRGMLHYHMGWVDKFGIPTKGNLGKGLRPSLCLFTCQALGGRVAQALPAATALELVHNFSLIHDDIQDEDQERHHQPTIWVLWGKSKAMVAGNVMLALADITLLELSNQGVSDENAALAIKILTGRYLDTIEGQYLDLSFEQKLDIKPEQYLEMVEKKTGSLIQGAMHLGALLGLADTTQIQALRKCGLLLGLAFQARDDWLGIWGDPSLTGKAVGADIQRKKNSLPIVYGFARATKATRERLIELYRLPILDHNSTFEIMGILEQLGAREFVQGIAEEKQEQAIASSRSASLPHWAQECLVELADFIARRQH